MEPGEAVIALRKLDLAQKFPLFVGPEAARRPRGEPYDCNDGSGPGKPVLLTTYGALGANFDKYPLALDAWECGSGSYEYPAVLSEASFRRLKDEGFKAGQAGDFEKAEYCFRRLVNSFPKFGESHLNLASTYVDRIGRSGKGPTDPSIRPWIAQARTHLEHAVASDPPAPPVAKLMLGRLYAHTGEAAKARPLLDAVLQDASLPQSAKDEASSLIQMSQQAQPTAAQPAASGN